MLDSLMKRVHLGENVTRKDLIDHMVTTWKISRDEAQELIALASRDGVIFFPTPHTVKLAL